jgi:hypothetical protein
MHTELISFSATAPGAAGATATAVTGDSLIVKNSTGKAPEIVAFWAQHNSPGWSQIAWPSGHDTTRGYRSNVTSNEIDPRMPLGLSMEIQAQETITATIAGSAAAGEIELGCVLVHYPSLPGVTQRTLTWSQLLRRSRTLTTISATLTATAAGYTGVESITAESDLLRANTDYAVLGISTSTDVAAVCLSGPDTGYTRLAVPGDANDQDYTSQYFCYQARAFDRAMIPVINSGNKSSTFLSFLQNQTNVSPLVTLHLAQLGRE